MRAMADYTWAQNHADASALAEMLWTLWSCPVPVVGRVHGDCYAGGVGLAAVCDVLVAAEGLHFCLSEAKLGLLPATIGPYVVRALGEQATRRYFLTAERFSAARAAAQLGFVHEVVPPEALDARWPRSSPPWWPTARRRSRPASSWCRTWPGARSTPRCATTPPAASPTSAPAPKGREGVQRLSGQAGARHGSTLKPTCRNWPRWPRRWAGPAACACMRWSSSPALPAIWAGCRCPPGLQLLQHPVVLGAAGLMLAVEFVADKVPGVDTLWDAVHTFIRIPAGAALAAGVFGGDRPPGPLVAALLGGTLAATATPPRPPRARRPTPRPSRSPTSALSLLGDVAVPAMLWLAWEHRLWFWPVLAVAGGRGQIPAPGADRGAVPFLRGCWKRNGGPRRRAQVRQGADEAVFRSERQACSRRS
jgi:hypothetical protein